MTILPFLFVASAMLWFILVLSLRTEFLQSTDRRLMAALHKKAVGVELPAPRRLDTVMRDLTAIGGDTLAILTLITGITVLLLQGRGETALSFAAILLGSRIMGAAMKGIIKRPRPDLTNSHIMIFTSSFPSVHTLMAFSLIFAVMIAAQNGPFLSLTVAGSISLIIGATRLHFAVHWPSDILAGWLSGFSICTLAAHFLSPA